MAKIAYPPDYLGTEKDDKVADPTDMPADTIVPVDRDVDKIATPRTNATLPANMTTASLKDTLPLALPEDDVKVKKNEPEVKEEFESKTNPVGQGRVITLAPPHYGESINVAQHRKFVSLSVPPSSALSFRRRSRSSQLTLPRQRGPPFCPMLPETRAHIDRWLKARRLAGKSPR